MGMTGPHRIRVMYSAEQVAARVRELGVEITREFGFADSDHPHVYDDTRCAGTLSSGRELLL